MSYIPEKTIYLCLAHMSEDGIEQKYVKEAFDTNWVVPLGPNVNAFEEEESIDLDKISDELQTLESEMKNIDKDILKYCEELGIKAPITSLSFSLEEPVSHSL